MILLPPQAAEQGRSDTSDKEKEEKCTKPYRSTNVVHTTLVRRFPEVAASYEIRVSARRGWRSQRAVSEGKCERTFG